MCVRGGVGGGGRGGAPPENFGAFAPVLMWFIKRNHREIILGSFRACLIKFRVVIDVARLMAWAVAGKWWRDHEISLKSPSELLSHGSEVKGDQHKHGTTNGTIGYMKGVAGCLLCRRTAAAHGGASRPGPSLHTLITSFNFVTTLF